jgi:D-alanine-D-alanine ligase
MKKTKVAVIFNEPSPEFYVKPPLTDVKKLDFVPYFEFDTITPIEEYEILTKRLKEAGFRAYSLNITDDIQLLIQNLIKNKPDVIFNFVELFKENPRYEMNIVGVYELLKIPYTGAPPITLANCQNKVLAKRLFKNADLNTPDFVLIENPTARLSHNLNFPLIVKPAFEDASVGIDNDAIVDNNAQLKKRAVYVFEHFNQPVLAEEFIKGRELNVAIMGDKEIEALPISEIDFSEMPEHLHNIVSYQAKWDPHHEAYHKTIPICPAQLPPGITAEAKQMAKKAFRLMGCRDYARVDIRLSEDNNLYVLEVNPNPDLTESAGFMRSAETAGFSYLETLKKIIEYAILRKIPKKKKV